MPIKFRRIFLFAAFIVMPVFARPLYAVGSLSNQGNETVEVKILKSNGSIDSLTMDPGGSEFLPEGAQELMVTPRTGMHGDRVVKVTVISDTGKESTIEDYWKAHKIGEQKKASTYVQGYAHNTGNVAVNAIVVRQGGARERHIVHIGGAYYLPYDTVDVDVDTVGGTRGDEVIRLSILLPNGKKKEIKKG